MESYSPIIVLIVNVLRTLLVKKAMDIFLSLDDVEKKSLKIGLGVYCMLTTIVYSMFQVSVVYEICNCLGMITLTCFYQEIWKKRLWVSLVLFSLDMACSLIVLFIFGELAEFQQPAIQALLILICVTVISHISYPDDRKEMAFGKKHDEEIGRGAGMYAVYPAAARHYPDTGRRKAVCPYFCGNGAYFER